MICASRYKQHFSHRRNPFLPDEYLKFQNVISFNSRKSLCITFWNLLVGLYNLFLCLIYQFLLPSFRSKDPVLLCGGFFSLVSFFFPNVKHSGTFKQSQPANRYTTTSILNLRMDTNVIN